MLAGDRRLGLRSRSMDEPMDTIFIKHVRPHSPAAAAGLVPGDRVVAVNNQTIADLPYAEVVQLIQNSPAYLHLLVVPKENDLLQLVSGYTYLGASLLSDLLNSSSALGWGYGEGCGPLPRVYLDSMKQKRIIHKENCLMDGSFPLNAVHL